MQVIAFDTETELIRSARLAPSLVCVTWAEHNQAPGIVHHTLALELLESWLFCGHKLFVGHNVAYDFAVICERFPSLVPHVFRAYAEDRVTDTKIREQLLDIARGRFRGELGDSGRWFKRGYALADLARRNAGLDLQKDGWRYSYGAFIDTPLERWPEQARLLQRAAADELVKAELSPERRKHLTALIESDPGQCVKYPLEDATATLAVYEAQEKHAYELQDQYRQARAAWWLHLSSTWGLRTSPEGVAVLRGQTQEAYESVRSELESLGLVRPNGSRDTKAVKARMVLVCEQEGLPLRRTASHAYADECTGPGGEVLPGGDDRCIDHVCLDAEACAVTDDDVLKAYAELSTLKKVLTNDVEMLSGGTKYPVHTRYDIAETGRTTSSKPNIQNLRRLPGIREAFIPRPGYVFAQADYPQLELHTLAQCCMSWLGESKLAEALNAGSDPHLAIAASILGLTSLGALIKYEAGDEEVSDMRQLGKLANFGFPGGMGVPKLIISITKQLRAMNPGLLARLEAKCFLSVERMTELRKYWFSTWTEMPHYFARISRLMDPVAKVAKVESLFTQRIRGGATYCAACNSGFQGLGADCAKEAGWRVAQAQYVDTSSPLYNTRTVAFIHDELILEVPDTDRAHDAATELARLMREGANKYLPEVPFPANKIKPLLMRHWSKKAKPTFNPEGRLIPWQ